MDNSRKEILNCILLILQIGICMIASLALGGFLGYLAGKWLDAGYLILPGLALGAAAGYRNVYLMVKKYIKNPKLPEPERPSEEELRRKRAEEEFERWKQERKSDD